MTATIKLHWEQTRRTGKEKGPESRILNGKFNFFAQFLVFLIYDEYFCISFRAQA